MRRSHCTVCVFMGGLLFLAVFHGGDWTNRGFVCAQPPGLPGIAIESPIPPGQVAIPPGQQPAPGTPTSQDLPGSDLAQAISKGAASFRLNGNPGGGSPYFVDFTTVTDPRTNQTYRRIIIVDLAARHICVHAVDADGKIKLQSSRDIGPDMQFDFYNGTDPSPQQVDNAIKRARSN